MADAFGFQLPATDGKARRGEISVCARIAAGCRFYSYGDGSLLFRATQ